MNVLLNNYDHKILKNKNLVVEVLSGDFTIADMRIHRERLYSDRFFHPTFDIFHDIRDARMNFSFDELSDYLQHLEEMKAMAVRKTVILANYETFETFSRWFGDLSGKFAVNFKVCSSFSESVRWLGREQEADEINSVIETLRQASCPECFRAPNAFTGF